MIGNKYSSPLHFHDYIVIQKCRKKLDKLKQVF
jgi:hypothetical protein